MRTNEIEKQRSTRPFVPFRLCLTDGKAYEVRHPEMLLVSRTILAVAVHTSQGRQPEHIVFCDPVHVVRMEPITNGRTKRKRSAQR